MKHILTLTALLFATSCFGQEACQSDLDINANGAVDIADFLHVLGLFGDVDSDGDGVWDSQDNCIDLESCNFTDSSASFCTYPDAIGDCNGNCPEDINGDGVCDVYSCGNPVSYQGYDYMTFFIAQQCWFAENLRNENYKNGDAILNNLSYYDWVNTTSGAFTVYGWEDDNCSAFLPGVCDESQSLVEYGRLYNWYAVDDPRGLCPVGWHVPTDAEWMTLEISLGLSATEANDEGYRGTDQGTQMKATPSNNPGWNGSNSSGFTGLPGGFRSWGFNNGGWSGKWWSSSQNGSRAWSRGLCQDNGFIERTKDFPMYGCSIRCVQDSE